MWNDVTEHATSARNSIRIVVHKDKLANIDDGKRTGAIKRSTEERQAGEARTIAMHTPTESENLSCRVNAFTRRYCKMGVGSTVLPALPLLGGGAARRSREWGGVRV